MTEELIRAAIAGLFRQTAETIEGAHDHATLRGIVGETGRMANKIISIGEASHSRRSNNLKIARQSLPQHVRNSVGIRLTLTARKVDVERLRGIIASFVIGKGISPIRYIGNIICVDYCVAYFE